MREHLARLEARGATGIIFGTSGYDVEREPVLERELRKIIDNDRYPFSPRIRTLQEIRNMIRPEPKREPLPEPKHYEPPRAKRGRRG